LFHSYKFTKHDTRNFSNQLSMCTAQIRWYVTFECHTNIPPRSNLTC